MTDDAVATRDDLRRMVARLERSVHHGRSASEQPDVLAFDAAEIDRALPFGGLARGALHEVAGTGAETEHAAGATSFMAGIVARAIRAGKDGRSRAAWIAVDPPCLPALARCGIPPSRLLFVKPKADRDVVQAMDETLRSGCMAAVVGEFGPRLTHTATRRLRLAAEVSGSIGLLVRRSRRFDDPRLMEPSAVSTRWRVETVPSPAPLPSRPTLRGLGLSHWKLSLVRCRHGNPGSWRIEACDSQGRIRVVSDVCDRLRAQARIGTDHNEQQSGWRRAA